MNKNRNNISHKCPLSFNKGYDFIEYCKKEACAWWNVEEEACAVLVLSEHA